MTLGESKTLLVVDDEQGVLGLIAIWLRDAGYDIVTCSRYEDARRYLATQTPGGLITDVRLGAYNGLQLAMLLHDREPEAPIVVLSAFDDPLAKNETERLGGVFVLKPTQRQELLATIGEASKRQS